MLEIDSWLLFTNFAAADVTAGAAELLSAAIGWTTQKYKESPALVLSIALAVALPVLAISGPIIRLLLRVDNAPRVPEFSAPHTRPASAWQQRAWLESQSSRSDNYTITHNMVRIGRAADNDLCLENPTVHRYHAVLERTPDAEFIISYLGDPSFDGLLINNRPAVRERLRGGEIIQIGAVTMRFALQNPERISV